MIADFHCLNCGFSYETLTASPAEEICPECGTACERLYSIGMMDARREKDPHDFDPLELEEHLAAKAHYESPEIQAKIREGMTLRERGPSWLRPKPEKRFY